jgi:phage gpG-like protein
VTSGGSAAFEVVDHVSPRLAKVANLLRDGDKGVMRATADDVRQEIHNRTATGKDIDGNPFTPYATSTLRKPEYMGKRIPNLDLSGRMLESIFKQVMDGFTARLYFSGTHGGIGNSLLARVHHYGLKSGRGTGFTMPARPFFGLTDQQRERVAVAHRQRWEDRVRRAWGNK